MVDLRLASTRLALLPVLLALATGPGLGLGCGAVGLKTRDSGMDTPTTAGDAKAPNFALVDSEGVTISLDDLLAGGRPAVIVFYRGHW